jgi:hypothetical protein
MKTELFRATLRPYSDVESWELARYEKSKRTSDARKLAALVPAGIKATLYKMPQPFVPDLRQYIPPVPGCRSKALYFYKR